MIKNAETNTHVNLTDKITQLKGLNFMAAHNLRGAGANIKMLSEVLMNKGITDDCQEQGDDAFTITEAIQYIHESSVSLLSTLSMLMEVSDTDLNENIRYDDCDIADIAEHVARQLRGFIQQKNASIELDLELEHISYPMAYMESILYNFISNALKYCKSDVPLKIIVSTYSEDGRNVLSVKDNGIGIDLKMYGRKIFNLYQVFHPGYESKGVGLYIIRQQIESLGGSVSVESEVNEGSEFIVAF